jgi:hypothetical protein
MPERSEPEGHELAGERAVVKYKNQARKSYGLICIIGLSVLLHVPDQNK